MYSESNNPLDADFINIDINNQKAEFLHITKYTLRDYWDMATQIMSPFLYLLAIAVLLFAPINVVLMGFPKGLFETHMTASNIFVCIGATLVLFIVYITLMDYFFKTKLIATMHKVSFYLSQKTGLTINLWFKQTKYLIAKNKTETININSPGLGFTWHATKEHKKLLSQVKFTHANQTQKLLPPIKLNWFKVKGKPLSILYGCEAELKFIFEEIPKNGIIRIDVY